MAVGMAPLGWTDTMVQMLMVTTLAALCGGGIATWLVMRFWAPTIKRMAVTVDREARRRRALEEEVRNRGESGPRGVSVEFAGEAIRDLHNLTDDLDQHAHSLRALARRISTESTSGALPASVMQAAADRAEELARTAAQAHRTYKRVSHLLGDVESARPAHDLAHVTRAVDETPRYADERGSGGQSRVPRHQSEPDLAARYHAASDPSVRYHTDQDPSAPDHPATRARGEQDSPARPPRPPRARLFDPRPSARHAEDPPRPSARYPEDPPRPSARYPEDPLRPSTRYPEDPPRSSPRYPEDPPRPSTRYPEDPPRQGGRPTRDRERRDPHREERTRDTRRARDDQDR